MDTKYEIDFCLLIPCYNNYSGLIKSLNSVVYPDNKYLILIVDDGSDTRITLSSLSASMQEMKPVVILANEKNEGITAALNKGLSWIEENTNARYIARLDCGDTSAEERFIKQVQYMDAHPEIGLVGSWCLFQGKNTKEKYLYKTPICHEEIVKAMNFRNVFIHPTVMFRADLLKKTGYYPGEFDYAEDYAFFWKLSYFCRTLIFNEFLVVCEINKSGLSSKNKNKQLKARGRVVKRFSNNRILKIAGLLRLKLLLVLPPKLTFQLKRMRS